MPIAVSVIVPVYNPGAYLQPLLDSLDRQSLEWDRFEAIFVDDGSTDDTAGVLDTWAAARPHAVVIHQENHGWPGQPRNVALSVARGEYVQFVDQDDWLGDTALADLHAFAVANTSDVVVGKMIGISRDVPVAVFRATVPRVEIGREPIQDTQTPHKMFRRGFLDEIGLRFPEGKRRLEDHVFVTTAFLRARVISIYADADCYFHIARPDGGNAGFRTYDPVTYYRAVDEVLDIVDGHLPPGRAHDVYAGRWLRVELIGRLHSGMVRRLPRRDREEFYREISRIVRARYSIGSLQHAPSRVRIGAAVVRHATAREFFRYDRAAARTTVHAWREGDAVRLRLLVDGRERDAGARLSDLLRSAVPRIAEAVLADLGDDPALLPAAARSGEVGARLTVPLPIGVRTVTVAAHRGRGRGLAARVGARVGTRVGVDRALTRIRELAARVIRR